MRDPTGNLRDVAHEIKQRLSCIDVGRELGLNPNMGYMCICPFHDDRVPSLRLYPDGYFCFACRAQGDVVDLYMHLTKLGFRDALYALNREYGLGLLEDGGASVAGRAAEAVRQRKEAQEKARKQHDEYLDLIGKEHELRQEVEDLMPEGPDDPAIEEYNRKWMELQAVRADIDDAAVNEWTEPKKPPAPPVNVELPPPDTSDLLWGKYDPAAFSTVAPYAHILDLPEIEREFAKAEARKYIKEHGISVRAFDNQLLAVARSRKAEQSEKENIPPYTDLPALPQPDNAKDETAVVQRRVNPHKYKINEHGVFRIGAEGDIRISSTPILPVYKTRNVESGVVQICLAKKEGKHWDQYTFDQDMIYDAAKIKGLARYGFGITSETARMAVQYMEDMMVWNKMEIRAFDAIGRLGWVSEKSMEFVPYDMNLRFSGDAAYKELFESVSQSGTMKDWLEAAREVREGKNVAARILLAASFASPLVMQLNAVPFIVHCWSTASGIGKTVALKLAASVWGDPEHYMVTFNATNVAFERMCGVLHSLPLCLDELQTKVGSDIQSSIYNLTEGVGRVRGAKAGGLQQMDRWRNSILITGEEPLTDATSRAGAVNRVIDIEAGENPMFANGNKTVGIISKNYGHAGKLFIEELKEVDWSTVRAYNGKLVMDLTQHTTEKQSMAAALILIADWLATEIIFQDGHELTVKDILPVLQDKLVVDVNQRCLAWLLDDIAVNHTHYIPDPERGYIGECWGRIDDIKHCVYIIKSVFDRRLASEGYSSQGFVAWLVRSGMLVQSDPKHATRTVRLRGLENPVRCICLKLKSYEDGFVPVQDDDVGEVF